VEIDRCEVCVYINVVDLIVIQVMLETLSVVLCCVVNKLKIFVRVA